MLTILDDIITNLTLPLTEEMQADGWSQEARKNALEHLSFLRAKLLNGEETVESDVGAGLSRWLDTYGVRGGHVLSQISRLSVLMMDEIDQRRGDEEKASSKRERYKAERATQMGIAALDDLVAGSESSGTTQNNPVNTTEDRSPIT